MDWIMQTLTQLGEHFGLVLIAFVEDERLSAESGMNGHFAKPVDFAACSAALASFCASAAGKRESESVPETPKIQLVSAKAEAILCLRNMCYFRCFELHRQVGMMKKRKNVHGRMLLWGNSGGSIQGAAVLHPAVGRHADHDG